MKNWKRNLLAAASIAAVAAPALAGEPQISAARIAGEGPILDLNLPGWKKVRAVSVPTTGQAVTTPTNPNPAVKEISVRAAHNGQWLALLLEWKDATKSDRVVVNQLGDQVAVEFPIDPKAPVSPMMGNAGGRVNILQWRAALQHDLDAGAPTTKSLYPNALIDLYPDQVLRESDAKPYTGAVGRGNPVSRPGRGPVLDQIAEGWGSLTTKPDQHANGKGEWKDGKWRVVITLPMSGEDANAPHLVPGAKTNVAFAVWEGGGQEAGSRKAWSNWVPVSIGK